MLQNMKKLKNPSCLKKYPDLDFDLYMQKRNPTVGKSLSTLIPETKMSGPRRPFYEMNHLPIIDFQGESSCYN